MDVRALRRVGVMRCRFFYHFHIKTYWQSFWRIAGSIVAGLITKHAMHDVFSRRNGVEGMDGYRHGEVSGVDAKFFVRLKRKDQIFAGRVFNFSQDDVCGQIHLQLGGDKELRPGGVGVNVIPRWNAKIQIDHGRLSAGRGDQRNRADAHVRRFAGNLRGGNNGGCYCKRE